MDKKEDPEVQAALDKIGDRLTSLLAIAGTLLLAILACAGYSGAR